MKKIIFSIFFSTLFLNIVQSQVLWSSVGGSAWLTGGNWTGGVVPTGAQVAQFGTNPTGVAGVGINMNGATNNGANNQAVGAIEVTAARTVSLPIGNNSTTANGTLTLNGTTVNAVNNVILRNSSSGILTLQNVQASGTQTMEIALANTTDNIVNIDGTGGVTISSIISGAAKKLTLAGSGNGTLLLSAANTYTGLTTVSASTLQLNNASGNTLPATNDVTIGGTGTLKVSTNQTIYNLTLNTGGILIVDNGVTLTINGTFSHNGGSVTLSGSGTIAYGSNSTLSYGASTAQTTANAEFPAVSGPTHLTINNSSGVTLHATRSVSTGNLTLTAGNLTIGNNDITAFSTVGGTNTSHVYTNGTGKLILTAIGAGIGNLKLFPIGSTATSMTPVAIYNGVNIDYGARVETGFTYPIFIPNNAVNRTWFVQAATTPAATVNVNFFYSAGDGNAGFNYTSNVDHGVYISPAWNINQTGLVQAGSYQVATLVPSFVGGTDLPMVIGNLGAILSIPRLVELSAQKINNTAQLSWTNNTNAVFKEMVIERSSNGRTFETLVNVSTGASAYTDNNLLAGINYYRIKITDINGRISYTAVAAIINSSTGFDVVSLLPNIVTTTAQLNVTAAKKTQLNLVVTDMAGRPVLKQLYNAVAGSNLFTVNAATLSPGMYYITAVTNEGNSKTLPFVKQ